MYPDYHESWNPGQTTPTGPDGESGGDDGEPGTGGSPLTEYPPTTTSEFNALEKSANQAELDLHYSAILRTIDEWLSSNSWAKSQMTIMPTQLKMSDGTTEFVVFTNANNAPGELVDDLTSMGVDVVTGPGHAEANARAFRYYKQASNDPIEEVNDAVSTVRVCSFNCARDFNDFVGDPSVQITPRTTRGTGDTGVIRGANGELQVINEYNLSKVEAMTRTSDGLEAEADLIGGGGGLTTSDDDEEG